MYKLLLCWRYLRTRYIALASIISVTLGVATMIVVNSVMEGFRIEMQGRIHNILSDVVFESHSLQGFYDPEAHMDEIRRIVGDRVQGMTATVAVPAMLSFQVKGNWQTRPVQLIGIDERSYSKVGDFGQYLQHPDNRQQLSFQLREEGYDDHDHQAGPGAPLRPDMTDAGWKHRRWRAKYDQFLQLEETDEAAPRTDASEASTVPPPDYPNIADRPSDLRPVTATAATVSHEEQPTAGAEAPPADIFAPHQQAGAKFDPGKEQRTGVVLGISLAGYRDRTGTDRFMLVPGDDVQLSFPNAGTPPDACHDTFTIVDFYESKMSEYDSSFVFVPLRTLQRLRGMIDPSSGLLDPRTGVVDPDTQIGYATAIQIKLVDGADLDQVRDELRAAFPPQLYSISTWRDKQGPLLAAVQLETTILNVLLFLIIAVAGFGILAIFFMIVVEKTRDIGILKSLGASGWGIQGIFLSYGLSLGIVGAGAGLIIGLMFVKYINEIADFQSWLTGQEVFDPSIYYFQSIPTIVEPFTVTWIVTGALVIAVLASVLPARRAARLHPVEALRYE